MLENIFWIFGRRYRLWTIGLIGKKTIQNRSQKNLIFELMFCLQRVVYAGMNTDQRENTKRGNKS